MKPPPSLFRAILLLISLLITTELYAAELNLVLVEAKNSSISSLSPEEVRRLYLGVPVMSGGQTIKPIINDTDNLLREIFMQQVLFMSTDVYLRQTISRTYRTGEAPFPTYTDTPSLLKALETNPNAVTYMLEQTAVASPQVKIITKLWHGQD